MKNKSENNPQTANSDLGAVMCSSFQEIVDMLNRGISVFPKGYLRTLGEMKRQGLIDVDLYKDGTTVVRKNCT